MFKRLFSSLHLFSLYFLISCGHNSSEDISPQLIKIQEVSTVEDLDLNSVRLVSFSDNSFAPIGSVHKILVIGTRIIVVDKTIGNTVFIFDEKGKYLNHIYRIGDGPGEYKNLDNLYFDEKENVLILIPMDYPKKYFFDLDGNFIKEERFSANINYLDLLPLADSEILINNGSMNYEDGFKVYENQKLIKSAIPFVDYLDMTPLGGRNLISSVGRNTYNFTVGNRDTIFRYSTKSRKISVDYVFDFESPISKIDYANHPNPLKYFVESEMFIGIIDLFQNENFLSFTTFKYPRTKGRMLSKSSGKLYDTGELIHHEVGELGFEAVLGLSENGEFIAVLKAGEDGSWDFSKHEELEKTYSEMEELGPEDFALLFFEVEEKE